MANLITSVPAINTPEWEVYFQPFLDDPRINQLPFNISIGKMNKDIFFGTHTDKITGAKNACGWSFKGEGSTFTKKTLTPIELQANVEQCYTVLLKKLFGDQLPAGARRGELSPEIIKFMTDEQSYAFNRDLLSILFLGNDAATPDDYYSLMDGIYQELLNGAAANDGTVDAGALTSTSLNTTNFFATMKAIYDAQPRALRRIPKAEKSWIWTESVNDAYISYLETKTQVSAGIIQAAHVTDGVSADTFLGIPITVVGIVDERLEEDFLTGSPAAPTDPYRVILTNPKNHIILLDSEDGFANADVWYNKDEDKVKAVGSVLFDYQYGFGDQNVFAGF